MPPKCPYLSLNCEPVGVASTWSNRALSHKLGPICPTGSKLSNSMPEINNEKEINQVRTCMRAQRKIYTCIYVCVCVCIHIYMCMHAIIYQWMVTLYRALFVTLTTSVSPSFTSKVGPGNWPFTVMVLWVLHSLFTGVA